MDRAIRPISARLGGVEIVVSAAARRGMSYGQAVAAEYAERME